MSFVDGRVIRQRMAKKDARMAKIAAKRLAKSDKIVGAAECSSTQTAPDRNGQTLKKGAHRVTAIPHSTSTDSVRTDNTVTLAHACDIAAHELELQEYDTLSYELRNAAALLRQWAWQPIETAPKDGTSVILCVGDDIVGEARWIGEGSDEGWWWAGNDPGDYHGGKIETEPSVWQPLPLPPANTEAVTP